ncbi:MAG: hypothetical protein ACRELY_12505 [Polyangiaceae bacterium]
MSRVTRHALAICVFFGCISCWATTSAASDPLDTSYGRVDGDVSLVMGAGVTLAPRTPRPSVDLRLRYIETLGVFWDYEESFGITNDPSRVMSLGMELRPLFLARWLQGYEFESARPDLLLDSVGLELGAYFAQPDGRGFGARQGLQAGLGVELPLMTRAKGIWIGLHGGARWSDAVFEGADVQSPSDRSLFLSITLSWHVYFGTHVVDAGDVRIE